jgi:hypothetical protein
MGLLRTGPLVAVGWPPATEASNSGSWHVESRPKDLDRFQDLPHTLTVLGYADLRSEDSISLDDRCVPHAGQRNEKCDEVSLVEHSAYVVGFGFTRTSAVSKGPRPRWRVGASELCIPSVVGEYLDLNASLAASQK